MRNVVWQIGRTRLLAPQYRVSTPDLNAGTDSHRTCSESVYGRRRLERLPCIMLETETYINRKFFQNQINMENDNYSRLPCEKDHEENMDGRVYFYLEMRDYIRELVQAKSKETIDMKEE